jgi:pyruvate kinase
MRSTKIVITLGPSTDRPGVLRRLFEAGADVFRLNASHGTHEEHAARIAAVRSLEAELKRHVAILLDLQGPKIRLGQFEHGGCTLEAGQRFVITTEPVMGNCARACTSYPELARDVKPGDTILLADGSVRLRVMDADGVAVHCEVATGGPISDRKGINLPGVKISTPSMTRKDMADLQFGLASGIDMVALSFVRTAHDVTRLKLFLEQNDAAIPVIAKIEKPEGYQNRSAILEEADGIMVARGDLGVEMPVEKVPFIQKSLIRRARRYGKFVITATQMLESMIENPFPTRAEVSDVANAIYDGTDAVMLSAETSIGKFPVEAVDMMSRIATEAENSIRASGYQDPQAKDDQSYAQIVADAAYRAARAANVAAIVVFTSSGTSARIVANFRPPVPVYAFTAHEAVARRLAVVYGAHPVIAPEVGSTDDMLRQLETTLLERGWVKPGDGVVFVAGQPIGQSGTTNLMKLHCVRKA